MENTKITLKEWLKEMGLSIVYFAKIMKVDCSYVHKWSSGTHRPDPKILARIKKLSLGRVSEYEDLVDRKKRVS